MNRPILKIVFHIIMLIIVGCNMPAGFWESFHSNLITYKSSDQGPWGGDRVIHWVSEKNGTFSENETIESAKQHEWVLLERKELSPVELEKWKSFQGKPIFILINGSESSDNDRFPRHISEDAVLLKFDSKWTRDDPAGSGRDTTAYVY